MPARYSNELRHLRYVIAVSDAGGIAAASRQLRIAQPSLSRQIRDLEQALGATLFERRGRGVVTTAAGIRFVEAARDVLERVDAAADVAARMAKGAAGAITIGFNETASWHGVIPDTLRAFRSAHPDISLTAVPMSSVEQCAALRRGRIEAGFVYALHGADECGDTDDLASLDLATEPLMLAVHRDDALASLSEPVPLAVLARAPLVWFEREVSPVYNDQVMAAFARNGPPPVVVQRTTNTSAMLALVNSGVGYTFAPLSAKHRKPTDVLLRALDAPELEQTQRLAWRRGDTSPVLERFVTCARAIAR